MSDEKIDISRALKSAITTGKVEFGVDQTMKAVKDGKAQMVVLSRNCPSQELRGDIGVKVHVYDGNNMELGAETTWNSARCAENPSPCLPL